MVSHILCSRCKFNIYHIYDFDLFSCLQRVHLDIEVGEHANDYKQIAEKDKLTELQLRVRQLLDQVAQVQKEQNYQRVSLILETSATIPRTRHREIKLT